jgi:hypothetical protein
MILMNRALWYVRRCQVVRKSFLLRGFESKRTECLNVIGATNWTRIGPHRQQDVRGGGPWGAGW